MTKDQVQKGSAIVLKLRQLERYMSYGEPASMLYQGEEVIPTDMLNTINEMILNYWKNQVTILELELQNL